MTTHEFKHVGLSGCELELITNKIIRKRSPSNFYNERLKNQLNKQLAFNSSCVGIKVPKIISYGYINELFYFDMEYIEGKLFDQEFINNSKHTLDVYSSMLISFIEETKNQSCEVYTENQLKDVLLTKLTSLDSNSSKTALINRIKSFIESTKLHTLDKGTCHGDLTLSNILFLNEEIFLLDFLDSYIESYIIDIVKLKQDLCHHWNLNIASIDPSLKCKLKQIFRYLWNKIELKYADVIHTDMFDILDLVNLLRIEPYVKTDAHKIFLNTLIEQTELYEKLNSTNDGKIISLS